MYIKYGKRILDVSLSVIILILLIPLVLVIAVLIKFQMGSPILFCQKRPGKDKKIFKMYKFRSMTEKRDKNGYLLADENRLTPFGRLLRESSLDELPELLNVLKGEMSLVGPRPQLIRDMVFFTEKQMKRQIVLPGITGLAQINGRNNISWEEKFEYDLRYLEEITFYKDMQILFKTIWKVIYRENVNMNGMATAEDLGDYLLRTGKITMNEYKSKIQGENYGV